MYTRSTGYDRIHGEAVEAGRLIREGMFGVTSIEMRCECGDVTERRLVGDHTK